MAPKAALVTGGTGSVGEEIVLKLAEAGYRITFQYATHDDKARKLSAATGAESLKLDFRTFSIPDALPFDILINSAGISQAKSLVHETDETEIRDHLEINLIAAFKLTRACLPHMISQGWGRVINIGSIYSLRGCARNVSYNISKHALSGFTKSVALDYASFGITSNEICPSAVESAMMQRIAQDKADHGGPSAEEFLRAVRQANPAGRMAVPADIAAVVLSLISDASGFVNGVSIPVDGGQIA